MECVGARWIKLLAMAGSWRRKVTGSGREGCTATTRRLQGDHKATTRRLQDDYKAIARRLQGDCKGVIFVGLVVYTR